MVTLMKKKDERNKDGGKQGEPERKGNPLQHTRSTSEKPLFSFRKVFVD